MAEEQQVAFERGRTITARRYDAGPAAIATLVLAHGAGGGQASAFMVEFATGLSARGLHVVTFNFPFTERGKRLPDPQPVLESCFRAILAHVAADPVLGALPLFIGGKSLGGRMASHVAAARDADEAPAGSWWDRLRGLVFLGYPLHPPGKPEQLRDAHLPGIACPMLFVQGTRDAFAREDLLLALIARLTPRAELVRVAEADHSFRVLKSSGRTAEAVQREVERATLSWLEKRGL